MRQCVKIHLGLEGKVGLCKLTKELQNIRLRCNLVSLSERLFLSLNMIEKDSLA